MTSPHLPSESFVFVYGTLRKGGRLHYVLKDSELVCNDSIQSFEMYAVNRDYPGIVPRLRSGYIVQGEVYKVDLETLMRLDFVEGAPSLFLRTKVVTDKGYDAFVYVWNLAVNDAQKVGSGDWMNR